MLATAPILFPTQLLSFFLFPIRGTDPQEPLSIFLKVEAISIARKFERTIAPR